MYLSYGLSNHFRGEARGPRDMMLVRLSANQSSGRRERHGIYKAYMTKSHAYESICTSNFEATCHRLESDSDMSS